MQSVQWKNESLLFAPKHTHTQHTNTLTHKLVSTVTKYMGRIQDPQNIRFKDKFFTNMLIIGMTQDSNTLICVCVIRRLGIFQVINIHKV